MKNFDIEDKFLYFPTLKKRLNILKQQRTRFDSIGELAAAIRADKQVLNPLLILKVDKRTAVNYVNLVRKAYGGRSNLVGLKKLGDFYYFLIAGERRTRAVDLLYYGGKRRRSLARIPLKVYSPNTENPDLREILLLQTRENHTCQTKYS